MKKFLSFLLTFVMLFSLSMPAFAAETDPTVNGGTSGDVSGTFNPGTVEFTGITVDAENTSSDYRYDETTKTYTILIPADDVGGRSVFVIDVVGNNLKYIPDTDTQLSLKFEDASGSVYEEAGYYLVQILRDHDRYGWSIYDEDGHCEKISYTNDGGESWTTYTFNVKQSYFVTVNASENGTVTANEYAIAGETVNLTVTPDEGYMLDKLTVMNGETEVEVTNNSFTMPAGAVTVTATFKVAPVYYNVTVNEYANGEVVITPDKYTKGETVTLTVTPASGYKLSALTVMNGETPVDVTPGENNTYTFTMPEGDVIVNVTFEEITYAINIGTFEGGSVVASVNDETVTNAAEGDTVTLTVTTTGIYQLKSIAVKDASNNTVEFATTGEASGIYTFTMPASDVTVEAVFEENRIVSADLVWGSLAYTYTDENGWQNQSSEANAGTVTVTNTGNVPFNVKATYSAELAYMNIRGTFDNGVTTLAAGENQSFKLTLHNKPEQVLNGQKIGTVTVHISETEFADYVTVTNEQELLNALADGGAIKFGNDITVSSIDVVEATSDISIDLNGFTFGGIRFDVLENVTVSISGGTIGIRPDNLGGNLTVSDCTVTKGIYAFVTDAGTTTINNSTVYGVVYTTGGTVELGADVMLEANRGYIGLWCDRAGASIVCHFDPSESLYNEYNKHTVTNNGDGTWTVTRKQS